MTPSEAEAIAQKIAKLDENIEYAIPNYKTRLDANPNDPFYNSQWNLWDARGGVNAPAAWAGFVSRSPSDPLKPIIAIIDSGFRRHVDLDAVIHGPNYFDGSGPPLDTGDSWSVGDCPSDPSSSVPYNDWHGTRVQSIMAAGLSNAVGATGIVPSATIYQTRVWGKCGGTIYMMINAINDAVNYRNSFGARIRIINISMSGVTSNNICWAPLQEAISNAYAAGVVTVVSAGNDSYDAIKNNPANCAHAIAVAASGRDGLKTSYSNYGSSVAISAPGGAASTSLSTALVAAAEHTNSGPLPADTIATDYWISSGTSFAAPAVSAAAAMMLSVNPALSPSEVRARLQASAKPFPSACSGCGAGLLDIASAVQRATQPSIRNVAQVIDFPQPSNRRAREGWFTVKAVASSGLPISLASTTPQTCVLSGLQAYPVASGTCTISASQGGDATYLATGVVRSFQISP